MARDHVPPPPLTNTSSATVAFQQYNKRGHAACLDELHGFLRVRFGLRVIHRDGEAEFREANRTRSTSAGSAPGDDGNFPRIGHGKLQRSGDGLEATTKAEDLRLASTSRVINSLSAGAEPAIGKAQRQKQDSSIRLPMRISRATNDPAALLRECRRAGPFAGAATPDPASNTAEEDRGCRLPAIISPATTEWSRAHEGRTTKATAVSAAYPA